MSKAICKPLLALIFAVVSVPYVLADAHPGLKNAIDKGDYKTAQNLKQKMNVRGYYLPAALSIKDAEFIYGPLTRYKWLLGLDHYDNCSRDGASECSPEFIDKYIVKICSGTTEFDVTACIDWMKSIKMNDIDRYKENFCRTKENIRACSLYVSMLDWNEQLKYLNDLDKKGLVKIPIITEIDTVVKEKVPKKECLAQWNDMYKVIKASIKNDSRYCQSRGYFYEAIICSFDGSAAKEQKCLSYLDEFSTMMKKECSSGKMEKDVSKKMKVKRIQKPFEDIIRKYSLELEKTPWFEMDEEWSEKIRFVQKYEKKEETEIAKEITDYYASYGDIPLSKVKKACILYPAIDKSIEKNLGVNIFSCSEIFKEYPNYIVGDKCETKNSNGVKRLPAALKNDKDSVSVVCDVKSGKYRKPNEFESLTEDVCENPESSWIKKYGSTALVCDAKIGAFRYADDYEKKTGKLCENVSESWMDTTHTVVCDKELGKFRSVDDYEKKTGKLCENVAESWMDVAHAVVCDKELGIFRDPTELEKKYGLCNESVQKQEIFPFFVCFENKWEDLNKANTNGLTFKKGEIKKGKINQEYRFFKDARDGNVYRTIKIGHQMWMAENLRYQTKNFKCADGDKVKYGCYYGWRDAMRVCPEGWRLPTKEEWETLIEVAGGISAVGKALRSTTDWTEDGGGMDKFGFAVFPAGIYDGHGSFSEVGSGAYFWSATEFGGNDAYFYGMTVSDVGVVNYYKTNVLSVRCVKD